MVTYNKATECGKKEMEEVNVMSNKDVAKRLVTLRKRKEETQEEVAQAVGISVSAIKMYEIGLRIPRDPIKIKLAKHFDVSVEFIFFT